MTDLVSERLGPGTDLDSLQGRRAGFVTRAAAFLIDFLVVVAGYPGIMWGIGVLIGLVRFEQPQYPELPNGLEVSISAAWTWCYFAGSWYAVGRTVGQAVMGVRVVGRRRFRVGLVRSLLRTWVMFLTLFVVGPVWLLLSASRLAIHDRVAGTQVIYDRSRKRSDLRVGIGPGRTVRPQPK
ncbi:RDD family protein [Rhabdothermincola sp.]|uniref:RDD family protein n=1 Tax=Rhabdothermincola sp. TaxID=2820405 RepID=UPI002FE0FC41